MDYQFQHCLLFFFFFLLSGGTEWLGVFPSSVLGSPITPPGFAVVKLFVLVKGLRVGLLRRTEYSAIFQNGSQNLEDLSSVFL